MWDQSGPRRWMDKRSRSYLTVCHLFVCQPKWSIVCLPVRPPALNLLVKQKNQLPSRQTSQAIIQSTNHLANETLMLLFVSIHFSYLHPIALFYSPIHLAVFTIPLPPTFNFSLQGWNSFVRLCGVTFLPTACLYQFLIFCPRRRKLRKQAVWTLF